MLDLIEEYGGVLISCLLWSAVILLFWHLMDLAVSGTIIGMV